MSPPSNVVDDDDDDDDDDAWNGHSISWHSTPPQIFLLTENEAVTLAGVH